MQIYVTTIGSQLFTQALAARTVVTFTKIRVGSAIISNYTQSELVALSDVVNFVYEDDSPNFSYTIQNSNLIVWDALLIPQLAISTLAIMVSSTAITTYC